KRAVGDIPSEGVRDDVHRVVPGRQRTNAVAEGCCVLIDRVVSAIHAKVRSETQDVIGVVRNAVLEVFEWVVTWPLIRAEAADENDELLLRSGGRGRRDHR